jgi:reactive intermediate/imine deaminase
MPNNPDAGIVCKNSEELFQPAGHYSHVCIANGFAYLSGQLPLAADGAPLTERPFDEQAAQVLRNIDACLAAAGVDRRSLVQVRVYVTDMADWPAFNRLYAAWIGEHRPARAVAGVAELHYGLALEVDAIALAAQPTLTTLRASL